MDDKTKLKNSVLSNLRAVLLSVKGTCSLRKVTDDYYMLLGEEIPLKKLGYKTLLEFVTKENAFKIIKSPTGEVMVDAAPDAKSAHIVDMITKQKTKPRGSRGRSRRFAPIHNTVSTNNRIPSSQNSNWKPKKLTPVKSKRSSQQQSSSNRNRRPQRSLQTNIASDRLKAIQNVADNSVNETPKETIIYQNSKPKDSNEHPQQQTTVAITKRQQSFVKQQSGGGDNNDINNRKSIISRENSYDSTINNNINKMSLSRQSSSNNETVVDLLKNIPKELLRDVPFDNIDITFNDILDRTSNTTILNNNNNKYKQLSPSSSIISNISNATSTSTTHDDDSSIYSTSELVDVTDHTSSNSTSPTILNDTANNKKWSSTSVPSSILVTTSRGRGRLVKPLIQPQPQPQPQSPIQTQDEQIYSFNQFNTKQFADSLQTTTPSVVNHVPKTKLASEKQLCDLMNELQIDSEIEYKVIPRPHNHAQLFNAQVKIGHHVQCSTWPDEFAQQDDALDAVFKKAIIEVNKQYSYIRLPLSSINVIGDRLRPLIAEHPTGIWNDTIEKLYTQKYNERLPNNWLCLANKYGIATECAPNEKFILTLMDGYVHPSTILPASLSTIDDDLNNSISAPILPTSDDNYLSVVITCTNSTTDVAFRIIGTPLSERYRRLTIDMEKYYNKENIKPVDLQKISAGNYYAVSNNNTWMRVRVLEHPQISNNSVDDLEILCSFIDHGHEYPINIHNLHELPYSFRSIPAQAIHCSLVGLEEFSETEIALPYLEDLVGKHLFLKVFEDFDTYGGLSVVLFDTTSDEDVNINIAIMEEVCKSFIKTLTHNEIKEMNIVYADENGYVYLYDITTNNENNYDLIFIDLMEKLRTRVEESIYTTKDVQYVTNCLNIQSNDEHLYLAKYSDGSFYRCKFIEVNKSKNTGIVFFIDYGNTLAINFNLDKENVLELSSYSHALQKIPPQCIKAILHYNVPTLPSNIGDKLMKIINTINDQNQSILVKVLVPAGDKPYDYLPVVELFTRKCTTQDDKTITTSADNNDVDINTLYSINKVLGLLMREPKIEENNNNSDNKIQPKQQSLYDLKMFPSNSTFPSTGDLPSPDLPMDGTYFDVNIPSAVNPWNFFIQPYKDGKELKQWMLNLQEYYKNGPGSIKYQLTLNDVKPGECYVALHHPDNTWYRACVNQTIDNDSISAFFVDYGQYVVLNLKQLKPLHSKFKKLPFQVLKARLSGITPVGQKWSVDDCRIFQELVVGKQFVCTIKEIGRDILHNTDNVLSVLLIDTSTNVDIQIHRLLIQKSIAVPTPPITAPMSQLP